MTKPLKDEEVLVVTCPHCKKDFNILVWHGYKVQKVDKK